MVEGQIPGLTTAGARRGKTRPEQRGAGLGNAPRPDGGPALRPLPAQPGPGARRAAGRAQERRRGAAGLPRGLRGSCAAPARPLRASPLRPRGWDGGDRCAPPGAARGAERGTRPPLGRLRIPASRAEAHPTASPGRAARSPARPRWGRPGGLRGAHPGQDRNRPTPGNPQREAGGGGRAERGPSPAGRLRGCGPLRGASQPPSPCLCPAALPSEGAGDPSGRGVPACPEHRAERGRAGSAQRGPGSPRRCAPAVPAPRPSHRGREVPVRRRSRVTWASAALPKIPEKREFITSLEHRKQELAEICFA